MRLNVVVFFFFTLPLFSLPNTNSGMSEESNSSNNSSNNEGDTCTVLTVVGPVRTVRREEVLRECGRYVALVRPETAEQQALLYAQGDLCVFAEAAAPEDAVAVSSSASSTAVSQKRSASSAPNSLRSLLQMILFHDVFLFLFSSFSSTHLLPLLFSLFPFFFFLD